ncbi:hypothetical protein COI_1833 [Mannheimia haemolytica serotype A2 str. OVINE]|nr:hypothetical protein COI_1833 [Mannheimia haemolytica serotype A2 str. OVINE]
MFPSVFCRSTFFLDEFNDDYNTLTIHLNPLVMSLNPYKLSS